jgi:hypothetical protein
MLENVKSFSMSELLDSQAESLMTLELTSFNGDGQEDNNIIRKHPKIINFSDHRPDSLKLFWALSC